VHVFFKNTCLEIGFFHYGIYTIPVYPQSHISFNAKKPPVVKPGALLYLMPGDVLLSQGGDQLLASVLEDYYTVFFNCKTTGGQFAVFEHIQKAPGG